MAQAKVKADVPIEALLKEKRKFPPPKAFVKNAVMNRKSIYAEAQRNFVKFWEQRARELDWFKPWKKALDWKPPYAKWFVGGKLNVAYNCLDRHVTGPRKTKAALIWEGEPGDSRVLTYWDLYREVSHFAAALKRHGVKKGDRVTIYMGMVPEVAIAMLAPVRDQPDSGQRRSAAFPAPTGARSQLQPTGAPGRPSAAPHGTHLR